VSGGGWHEGQNGGNQWRRIKTSPCRETLDQLGHPQGLQGSGIFRARATRRRSGANGRPAGSRERSGSIMGWHQGEGLGVGEQASQARRRSRKLVRLSLDQLQRRGGLAQGQRSARRNRSRAARSRGVRAAAALQAAAAWASKQRGLDHSGIEGRLRRQWRSPAAALPPPQQGAKAPRAWGCSCQPRLQQPRRWKAR